MQITEKEFAIIKEITNNHQPDQRTIARKAGISLGLTNLIIKRLINKGYVKAKQLNRRKIQYILTPKGFTEKAKKSYNFTMKTINIISSMKQKIQSIILLEYDKGCREFVICGAGEIASLIELVIKETQKTDIKIYRAAESQEVPFKSPFYLYTGEDTSTAKDGINVVMALSENL
jgi:DNA-binding MarR family transcriptional regulator